MKNFKKGTDGITLVALVVTIVVLLILAGISLSLILGNYGVIKKANEGRANWANASVEEQEELNTVAEWMDNYANGKEGNSATSDLNKLKLALEGKELSDMEDLEGNILLDDGGKLDYLGSSVYGDLYQYNNNKYILSFYEDDEG